jgi:hypothetical protein
LLVRIEFNRCSRGTTSKSKMAEPRAKARLVIDAFFRWTEVQLPLLKQGAPTELRSPKAEANR